MRGRISSNSVFIELQDHILAISARRSRMFGLDAPTEVKASGVALIGLSDLASIQDAMQQNVTPSETEWPSLPPKN